MAVTKIKPIKSTLSKALDYIENPDKTDGKMLVSSFGCSYETADIEFEYTLSQALQKGNNLAFHLIQSFEPGEVDYQKAHEIGKQLADAVTKGQHEMDSYYVNEHIINLLLEVRGNLRTEKQEMLSTIDRFLALPTNEKLLFTVGRRLNIFFLLDDLKKPELHQEAEKNLQQILSKNPDVDFAALCNYVRQSQI